MDFLSFISFIFAILLGYVVGSVNFSIIVTKYVGKFDIHTKGSGNAGGTNVARTMGAKYGISVMLIEFVKCLLVGLFCRYIFPVDPFSLGFIGPIFSGYAAVFGCLIGNIFPIFHGFSGGGKGVVVTAASICLVDWRIFLALLAVFLVIFFITRMVSAGSLVGALAIPVCVTVVYHGYEYWYLLLIIAILMSAVVIIRHRKNIVRIFKGEENKFSFGRKNR